MLPLMEASASAGSPAQLRSLLTCIPSKHPASNTFLWNMLNTRQKTQARRWRKQHFVPLNIEMKYQNHSPRDKSDKALIYQKLNIHHALRSSSTYRPERTYWHWVFTGLGVAKKLGSARIENSKKAYKLWDQTDLKLIISFWAIESCLSFFTCKMRTIIQNFHRVVRRLNL